MAPKSCSRSSTASRPARLLAVLSKPLKVLLNVPCLLWQSTHSTTPSSETQAHKQRRPRHQVKCRQRRRRFRPRCSHCCCAYSRKRPEYLDGRCRDCTSEWIMKDLDVRAEEPDLVLMRSLTGSLRMHQERTRLWRRETGWVFW